MSNVYETPKSDVENVISESENNSGLKQDSYPEGVKGFSWGAFFLNWIWAIFNKTWIGLFSLLPYVGFIFALYLGFRGRQLAWKNKEWESVEHFDRVQKRWSFWGVIIMVGIVGVGILAAIAIPAYQEYMQRVSGG